jgi:hypothetical protein
MDFFITKMTLKQPTSQSEFQRLSSRLEMLERWRELAIRPDKKEDWMEDSDLFNREIDDCQELMRRCLEVRAQMNENLPPVEKARDEDLVPRESGIPEAGLGLFCEPSRKPIDPIPAGETLCYYTGHLHNYHSAKSLQDRSYLMVVEGDTLVDPGPLPHIKARFINDPLNETFVNCKFVPGHFRAAVVATRTIAPGEELFVSYGDGYWAQHQTLGRRKK